MDDRDNPVPGAIDVRAALRLDPLYRFAGSALTSPYVLGLVLALLTIFAIVLGPASESRFIYTDF